MNRRVDLVGYWVDGGVIFLDGEDWEKNSFEDMKEIKSFILVVLNLRCLLGI